MKSLIKIILFLCNFISLTVYSQTKSSIGIGGNISTGNTNIIGLNIKSSLSSLETDKHQWGISPNLVYTLIKENKGEYITKQRESYLTGSYSYKLKNSKILGFGELENSFLKKIDLRSSIGVGLGFDIIRKENITIIASEAIVIESYLSEINVDKNLKSLRISTRIKFEIKKPIKFTSINLFQPGIASDPNVSFDDNINLRSNNTIEIPISKKISFNINCDINGSTYSRFVDSSVKSYDVITSLMITYKNF